MINMMAHCTMYTLIFSRKYLLQLKISRWIAGFIYTSTSNDITPVSGSIAISRNTFSLKAVNSLLNSCECFTCAIQPATLKHCLHCKKNVYSFPFPSRDVTNQLSLAGKNLIIPGHGGFGWGRENLYPFYSVDDHNLTSMQIFLYLKTRANPMTELMNVQFR
jgi:hypothetical protein